MKFLEKKCVTDFDVIMTRHLQQKYASGINGSNRAIIII